MRISDWSSDVCSSDLIGEQRVARAIAVTRSRTLGPFHGQAAQTNFPEGAVIGEIDKTDVGTTGCALIGVIAARDRRTAQIGRAHVCTPVPTAHLVCRLLLENKNNTPTAHHETAHRT